MADFPYERLRRFPHVEAENLFAHDATDLLLEARARDIAGREGLGGSQIAVIGDRFGALALALTAAGLAGVRVHQDLVTGRRALQRNAERLGLEGFVSHELAAPLFTGVRLVLLQLPKALAELAEIADAIARWATPEVTLIAGGRVKHMTLGQNEVLARSFAHVCAERAARKSRLVVARSPLPVPPRRPFPVCAGDDLILCAHGGAFAGARLDIGTRVLLDALPSSPAAEVVDLGCGTGAVAATYALRHPDARVTATDDSAAAVASARATMVANGLDERVRVTHDDAGSELPDAAADLVLLNPPFHLGTDIHTGGAVRLFAAAARLLRPGGELLTVYNSALAYRSELSRIVGPTEQRRRTAKFTVTRSIRREGANPNI